MTLLDIGCGWGATMMRAVEKYDVNVVGLTLSENQHAHVEKLFADSDEPAVQAGAAATAGSSSTSPSTGSCRSAPSSTSASTATATSSRWPTGVLPDDGVMLLHTICGVSMEYARANGVPLTMELARFVKFIMTEIFPGGQLCNDRDGRRARGRRPASRSPGPSRCSRTTPGRWTSGPRRCEARRDEAIALQSEEVYDRYMHYLTGCARLFKLGQADVNQFTLREVAGRIGVDRRLTDTL